MFFMEAEMCQLGNIRTIWQFKKGYLIVCKIICSYLHHTWHCQIQTQGMAVLK